jgi:hypothetical protein
MKKEEFQLTLDKALEDAKMLLLRDGKLMPVALMYHKNNADALGLSFKDKKQKDEQLSLLKKLVRLKNADAIFVIVESWYVTTDKEDLTIEPSKDPMRKECIVVFGEYESGNLTVMQIFGRKDEKIVFEKKLYMEESISGKFDFGIKNRIKNRNKNLTNVRNLN